MFREMTYFVPMERKT